MSPSTESPALLNILAMLVEERAGLHYSPDDRWSFATKIEERAAIAGYDSLLDYYYYLRYDPDSAEELRQLTDALVVNETYFFRELKPLQVVLDRFVGPAITAGRRPRIWSAACSTGEEPLSFAMMLAERDWLAQAELVASDISSRVLARATQGSFGRRALRSEPPPAAARWLRRQEDGSVAVDEALIKRIDWREINLCDDEAVAGVGPCDLILCRNVLIYFSDATVGQVVERLARSLVPGGVLLVGISESLLRFGTALSCEELGGVFVYRKPT